MFRKFVIGLALCVAPTLPAHAEPAHIVVQTHNQAYADGDFESFLGTFAEDAVVVLDGLVIQGREAIAASYAANFSPDAPQVKVTRQGRLAGGGVAQTEVYVLPNGEELCCSYSTFRVQDGEIVRVDINTGDTLLGG